MLIKGEYFYLPNRESNGNIFLNYFGYQWAEYIIELSSPVINSLSSLIFIDSEVFAIGPITALNTVDGVAEANYYTDIVLNNLNFD